MTPTKTLWRWTASTATSTETLRAGRSSNCSWARRGTREDSKTQRCVTFNFSVPKDSKERNFRSEWRRNLFLAQISFLGFCVCRVRALDSMGLRPKQTESSVFAADIRDARTETNRWRPNLIFMRTVLQMNYLKFLLSKKNMFVAGWDAIPALLFAHESKPSSASFGAAGRLVISAASSGASQHRYVPAKFEPKVSKCIL